MQQSTRVCQHQVLHLFQTVWFLAMAREVYESFLLRTHLHEWRKRQQVALAVKQHQVQIDSLAENFQKRRVFEHWKFCILLWLKAQCDVHHFVLYMQ